MRLDFDCCFFSICSQSVIINILVYFGVIKNMFDSDIKEGDFKLLSSRLQNFLICIEMFFAALGVSIIYVILVVKHFE